MLDNRRKWVNQVKVLLSFIAGVLFMGIVNQVKSWDVMAQKYYPTYEDLGKDTVIWTKEKEVIKYVTVDVPYTLTARAQKCMHNNPEVAGKLKEMYLDWPSAVELVCRESGFNSQAINRSSGACGLPQSLPCSKMNCSLDDVDCQLAWQKQYIANRYGTVTKALDFHNKNNWY